MGHNSGNLKVQLLENNSAYFFFKYRFLWRSPSQTPVKLVSLSFMDRE